MLVASYGLSHLMFHTSPCSRYYRHPSFTNEEAETQLSESHRSNGLQSKDLNPGSGSPGFDQHTLLLNNRQKGSSKSRQTQVILECREKNACLYMNVYICVYLNMHLCLYI